MRLSIYLTAAVLTATTLFNSGALAADNAVEALCADCEFMYWGCHDVSILVTHHNSHLLTIYRLALMRVQTRLNARQSVDW